MPNRSVLWPVALDRLNVGSTPMLHSQHLVTLFYAPDKNKAWLRRPADRLRAVGRLLGARLPGFGGSVRWPPQGFVPLRSTNHRRCNSWPDRARLFPADPAAAARSPTSTQSLCCSTPGAVTLSFRDHIASAFHAFAIDPDNIRHDAALRLAFDLDMLLSAWLHIDAKDHAW